MTALYKQLTSTSDLAIAKIKASGSHKAYGTR